jgi:hypothetical protein
MMMKNYDSVQNEVRKTMDFLDKMPKLEGNPFMFTRIQSQLADQTDGRSLREGSRVWASVRTILLALLIVSNVVTIVQTFRDSAPQAIDRQEALSTLIDSSTSPNE